MTISIFIKYKVEYECVYSIKSRGNKFENNTIKWVKEMFGDELMQLIANIIKEQDTIAILSQDNKITLEQFANTGANTTIEIKYKMVKGWLKDEDNTIIN